MITTLIDADEQEWVRDNQNWDSFISHRRVFPRFFKVWDVIVDKKNILWSKLMFNTLCKIKGCDIQMNGWFGPDSGGEDWWCNRCGRGGRHIYY